MNYPVRVLHVFGRLDSGGAQSRTMDIYRNIDKNKVQFDFIIHTEDKCFFTDEVESLGGKIYSVPRLVGRNYFEYRNAWRKFFDTHSEYKIIHGHQTNTAFVYLKEAKKSHIPTRIAHSRNSSKENILKKYICKIARFYATDMFAVSKLAAISEFGTNLVNDGMVKIIPNAIEAIKYQFDEEIRRKKRLELGIEDEKLIIHIGRFHPQKNHIFLLDVFGEILRLKPSSKLLLVGDGSYRTQIENKIDYMGIKESVIFTGIRRDVHELLQAADLLLFPSYFEGLPGVVLEAQAAGLPCVISDTITEEVKILGSTRYLSLEEEAYFWAKCVIDLLDNFNRIDTYQNIVESGYNIKSVSKWYESYYMEQINKKKFSLREEK